MARIPRAGIVMMRKKDAKLKSLIDLFLEASISARYAVHDADPADAIKLLKAAEAAEDAARSLEAVRLPTTR